MGHICLDCPNFSTVKGNLQKTYSYFESKKKKKMFGGPTEDSEDNNYVYEEDDPRKLPHHMWGNMTTDK